MTNEPTVPLRHTMINDQDTVDSLRNRLANTNAMLTSGMTKVAELHAENRDLRKQVQDLSSRIRGYDADIAGMVGQHDLDDRLCQALTAENESLKADKSNLDTLVDKLMPALRQLEADHFALQIKSMGHTVASEKLERRLAEANSELDLLRQEAQAKDMIDIESTQQELPPLPPDFAQALHAHAKTLEDHLRRLERAEGRIADIQYRLMS